MFQKLFAVILIGATFGSAIPVDEGTRALVDRSTSGSPQYVCGNNPTGDEISAAEAQFLKNEVASGSESKAAAFTVNVYFNIIQGVSIILDSSKLFSLFGLVPQSQ